MKKTWQHKSVLAEGKEGKMIESEGKETFGMNRDVFLIFANGQRFPHFVISFQRAWEPVKRLPG